MPSQSAHQILSKKNGTCRASRSAERCSSKTHGLREMSDIPATSFYTEIASVHSCRLENSSKTHAWPETYNRIKETCCTCFHMQNTAMSCNVLRSQIGKNHLITRIQAAMAKNRCFVIYDVWQMAEVFYYCLPSKLMRRPEE